MDLISREETVAILEKYKFGAITNETEREYTKEMVVAFVENMPTIDAVPVVKGNWERVSDRPKTYIRRCSVCSRDSYTCFSERDYNFCPWCGAKMDGADMRKGGSNE